MYVPKYLCILSIIRRVDHPYRAPVERPPHGRGHGRGLSHRRPGQEEPGGVQGLHFASRVQAIQGGYLSIFIAIYLSILGIYLLFIYLSTIHPIQWGTRYYNCVYLFIRNVRFRCGRTSITDHYPHIHTYSLTTPLPIASWFRIFGPFFLIRHSLFWFNL